MRTFATTKLSSKGQVVIPEMIRQKLRLREGDQFVVFGDQDVIILKSIERPTMEEFDQLIEKVRKQAKLAGLTKEDVTLAIEEVRKEKRKRK